MLQHFRKWNIINLSVGFILCIIWYNQCISSAMLTNKHKYVCFSHGMKKYHKSHIHIRIEISILLYVYIYICIRVLCAKLTELYLFAHNSWLGFVCFNQTEKNVDMFVRTNCGFKNTANNNCANSCCKLVPILFHICALILYLFWINDAKIFVLVLLNNRNWLNWHTLETIEFSYKCFFWLINFIFWAKDKCNR